MSIHASAPHACTHRPTHPRTHTHHHYTFRCAPSNMHATAHDAADYCAYSLAALAHGIMSVQRSEPNGASHEAYLPCAMPHAASHAAWSEPRVTAASRAVQVERRQDLRSALGARLGLVLRWEVRPGRVLLSAVGGHGRRCALPGQRRHEPLHTRARACARTHRMCICAYTRLPLHGAPLPSTAPPCAPSLCPMPGRAAVASLCFMNSGAL